MSIAGLEQFVGRVRNRMGSFAFQGSPAMEGDSLTTPWFVVAGSGTGDLASLRGEGTYDYTHGEPQTPLTFAYEVDS
jgi:hypothetical protein